MLSNGNKQVAPIEGSLTQCFENSCLTLWTINSFYQRISSQVFSTGLCKENVWRLELNKERNDYSLGLCLKLTLVDSKTTPLVAKVEYHLVTRSPYTAENFHNLGTTVELKRGESTILPLSILKQNTYCHNKIQHLQIYCRIASQDVNDHNVTRTIKKFEMQFLKYTVFQDLESILKSEDLSDVDLNVGQQVFHAHKAVLASRSPVFMAMFQNNMHEKLSNCVDIPDISPEVMQILLRYMYTNSVDGVENFADDLMAAAEKYQLEGLKAFLLIERTKVLSDNNVFESLILADRFNAPDLKIECLNYVIEHIDNIQKMRGFDMFASTHPLLLKE
ncbi:hypothetical protein QAD02_001513 [Eretmocerus hayati]|uniref:Uncharacterized protein n=1 Tax=Eretmocerus hayati TaxID=131215 RepID=A0ACC2NG79_9HYME|nr:hypothetical protein QAD02_001513 [Eretmocerus hayati]